MASEANVPVLYCIPVLNLICAIKQNEEGNEEADKLAVAGIGKRRVDKSADT